MSATPRILCAILVCMAVIVSLSSNAFARHDCDEGHYRIEEPSTSSDPPTSCLGLELVGELKGCEHVRLRIDNQCDTFVKTLDGTQAYCELTGSGATECQVIGSGIVGYVDVPWRKVVNTDERQQHRYDVQVEGRTTFLFVSFESTRVDSPQTNDDESSDGGSEDDPSCTTAPLGGPASALGLTCLFALGCLGLRRWFD